MNKLTEDLTPKEIFGPIKTAEELRAKYKVLAFVYHPDKGGSDKEFQLLQFMYELAHIELEQGTYDDPYPLGKFTTVTTKKYEYKVGRVFYRGGLSDLRIAEVNGVKCVLRVAVDSAANGRLQNEVDSLKALRTDEKWNPYLPEVLESFLIDKRRATVFNSLLGTYTLDDIAGYFPGGVDGVHFAWMYNRALEILGFVHKEGYVHCNIQPQHLCYNVVNHGLTLIDWTFAKKTGEVLSAVPSKKWSYPKEVLEKGGVYSGTDLYMLSGAFQRTVARNLPKPLQGFLNATYISNPKYRSSDAWATRLRMTDVLEQMYGEPKFVDMKLEENYG